MLLGRIFHHQFLQSGFTDFTMIAYKADGTLLGGTDTYAEAYGSTISVSVEKRTLDLSVNSTTKTFGESDPTFTATADASDLVQNIETEIAENVSIGSIYSKLGVNYSNPTADLTFQRITGENKGSYDITVEVIDGELMLSCDQTIKLQVFYGKDNYV